MALEDIKVPELGGATQVDVIEILVSKGDSIEKEDALLTLESDKASMDMPAPKAGVIKEIKVKIGDKVSESDVVMTVETAAKKEETAKQEPANTKKSAALQQKEISIPDLGGATDVDVIELLVQPGSKVEKDDSLITLEGDKASMEVPAPMSGILKEFKVKVGDKVNEKDPMAVIEVSESESSSAESVKKEESQTKTETKEETKQAQTEQSIDSSEKSTSLNGESVHAGPAVRRIAHEFGVDLAKVRASGNKGRVLKEDVQAYVKAALASEKQSGSGGLSVAPAPAIDFSKFGEVETKKLSKIKRLTGANTHRSWVSVPHVTQFDEADITEMENFRKSKNAEAEKAGYKLTPLVFLMKAVVKCLQALPNFNSSLDPSGENLIMKKYYHIGVAVETPNGLVVPVIRDVDKKGLIELSKELKQISTKAREKGLLPNEMSGSCFTISSLGGIGGTAFTPIVNTPDVAILGVSKSKMAPVYNGKEFVPRLMLPLSLSYDHRVIDGAEAARFTSLFAKFMSDIRELLL